MFEHLVNDAGGRFRIIVEVKINSAKLVLLSTQHEGCQIYRSKVYGHLVVVHIWVDCSEEPFALQSKQAVM